MDEVQAAEIELMADSPPVDLEELFLREYAKLMRLIARIIRDQSRAEELSVDAFLRISPAELASANASALLYRQAVRIALDELRRRNRRERLRHLLPSLFSSSDNPEKEYALRQRQLHVGLVLQRLRRKDAELLILRAEGFTYAELSSALKINPASVGVMLSRAQSTFRKEYLKRYGQP